MKSLIIASFFLLTSWSASAPNAEVTNQNLIQVAILLDTSGSMSGLINQAKSQLWEILNTLSDSEKNGEASAIEIALYEYGNSRLESSDNWILQRLGFTTDMDVVSKSLFEMNTSGGSEYCGEVIHQSVKNLNWKDEAGLRVIYIAGNEAFTQGNYKYKRACAEARVKEVYINTIFCGGWDEGVRTEWQVGAVLGKGSYHNIQHNGQTVYVASPYDDEIASLNTELNSTYIPYGRKGMEYQQNQVAQDKNSQDYDKANLVSRSIYKSKSVYKNTSWDLVDAYAKDNSIIKEREQLPEELSSYEDAELERKILEYQRKRNRVQKEIAALAKKRTQFLKTKTAGNETGLGHAMLKSVKKQLLESGFCVK